MLVWCRLLLSIVVCLFGLLVLFVIFCLCCDFGVFWLVLYCGAIVLFCSLRFEFMI